MPVRKSELKVFETYSRGNLGQSYALASLQYLADQLHRDESSVYLVPTFVITACTVVEAAINDCIIDHFQEVVGADSMKLARPLLYLNYRERLCLLFPLISNYRYLLDDKHDKCKELFRMLELRGRLIHVKHQYRPVTIAKSAQGIRMHRTKEADPDDPYDGEYLKPLRRINTRALFQLTNFWRLYLDRLPSRIRRKNFNPKDVLRVATRGW